MKRFDELTAEQKQKAAEQCLGSILEAIVTGKFRFNDELNKNNIQATIGGQIERACNMSEEERSGVGARQVAIGLIMESTFTDSDGQAKKMSDELLELALADAQESWFIEPRDKLVRLDMPAAETVKMAVPTTPIEAPE